MKPLKLPGLREWVPGELLYTPHPDFFPPMTTTLIKATTANQVVKCATAQGINFCLKITKQKSERRSNEAAILRGVTHKHIIKFIALLVSDSSADPALSILVMPLYRESLRTHAFLNYREILAKVGGCVVPALRYIHTRGIVHMDIKPQNIMVDPSRDLTLVDFDCALPANEKHTDVIGTVLYMPPEILANRNLPKGAKKQPYTTGAALDLWCLGATIEQLQITKSSTVEDETEALYWSAVADLKVINPAQRGLRIYYGAS